MEAFIAFFNVNTIFFEVIGYPISYLEFFGTIFNLASVILVARRNIWNWPVAIIGVVLFGILFYQIQLYADFFEQIYYLITGFWGWYLWQTHRKKEGVKKVQIATNTLKQNIVWGGGIIATTVLLGFVLYNIHIWLPQLFPAPATAIELDALTTVMSFAATILMIKRRVEAWVLWVLVDVIAIGLYWYKAVPFIALLYALFLIIASKGLVDWWKAYKNGKTI